MFPCEFCEISKNTIFIEHLWVTAPIPLIEDMAKVITLSEELQTS